MLLQLTHFYIALFLVFALPGYFLMRAVFSKNYVSLSALEKMLITFVLSLATTNSVMLLMNYSAILITRKNLLLGLLSVSFIFGVIWFLKTKFSSKKSNSLETSILAKSKKFSLTKPSYRQILIFIMILLFATLIRAVYISDGIFPKTTDFGHHIYWANYITINGTLPEYSEKFIIGEHLPFAAVSILSHLTYVGPLAVIVLFLFNLFSLLAFFVLVYTVAVTLSKSLNSYLKNTFRVKKISAMDIALWSLFLVGIIYPISAPQVKFVSGGVIGNIIGNFLIITAIYSFLKTIKTKQSSFASLFLVSVITLVYTHHLSSYIFIYSFIAILATFILLTLTFVKFDFKRFFKLVSLHIKPFISIPIAIIILLSAAFLFEIRTPSYLNKEAIDVAVGTPTKITRVGFNLTGIIDRIGAWRVLFAGAFSVLLLPILFSTIKTIYTSARKKGKSLTFSNKSVINLSIGLSIAFSWGFIIFLMSWKPALLQVDIPSRRIVTYLTYPLTILASFGFVYFFVILKARVTASLFTFLFLMFIGIGLISGLGQDINANYRKDSATTSKEVMQTYMAAMYLEEHSSSDEMVLKDHKFLKGDTWMKLFFMRDYKYPLSRTYDRRYDDIINVRETCTRDMVLKPNSEIGEQCFVETSTKYIVLKKGYDDAVFKNASNFQQVYSSNTVTVFQKK